jgi:hypothetical protein
MPWYPHFDSLHKRVFCLKQINFLPKPGRKLLEPLQTLTFGPFVMIKFRIHGVDFRCFNCGVMSFNLIAESAMLFWFIAGQLLGTIARWKCP